MSIPGSHTLYWGCSRVLFSLSLPNPDLTCGGGVFFCFVISVTQLWHFLPPLPVHLFPTECCCTSSGAWGFCRCWGNKMEQKCFTPWLPNYRHAGWGQHKLWHSTSWNGHQLRRLSSFKTAGSFFTPRSTLLHKPATAPLVEFFQMGSFPSDSILADLWQDLFLTPPFVFKARNILFHITVLSLIEAICPLGKWEICTYIGRKSFALS